MTTEERTLEIKKLIVARNIKDEQVKLLELESSELDKQIKDITWIKMSWEELTKWLKENSSNPANYYNNPIVKTKWHIENNSIPSYCFLRFDKTLQIGAYQNNDAFPHDCDLYVRYDYITYRNSFRYNITN